ncbi:hypothetical protein NPIL_557191 [Nephila pilipes]|uniref:Uncharacterized protein n=1 Tax=Nephila pilipes TaxID=299642 RepID=A0A8X6PC46_NEPPI|nr:hypothetical protein NPIL_557191 [Nephila pilipes]
MGIAVVLLLMLGLSQYIKGQNSESGPICPPTIVDCACIEDLDYNVIQINVTTGSIAHERLTSISDVLRYNADTSLNPGIVLTASPTPSSFGIRCFPIKHEYGKKIPISNSLQEDDDIDRPPSRKTPERKGQVADELMLDKMLSQFYPVEIIYPRLSKVFFLFSSIVFLEFD